MGADGRLFAMPVTKMKAVGYIIPNRTSCLILSFYQSFPRFFLHTAESGVFSKFFVDTLRFLW